MRTSRIVSRSFITLAAFSAALVFHSIPAVAQTSKSAAAAKELAAAMDAAKLESIAAPDPSEPGTFVAALYFPGSQILAVSAKYAAPPLLVTKMKEKNYRDIYIDLNSASIAGTKIFIMDQGVDGFVAKPGDDQPADSWEQGTKQVTFNGKWKDAKMSEDEYMKAFAAADERYAHILSLLAAQAKASGS
jgi:hypothetical protein